jgi:hypothetical protein
MSLISSMRSVHTSARPMCSIIYHNQLKYSKPSVDSPTTDKYHRSSMGVPSTEKAIIPQPKYNPSAHCEV